MATHRPNHHHVSTAAASPPPHRHVSSTSPRRTLRPRRRPPPLLNDFANFDDYFVDGEDDDDDVIRDAADERKRRKLRLVLKLGSSSRSPPKTRVPAREKFRRAELPEWSDDYGEEEEEEEVRVPPKKRGFEGEDGSVDREVVNKNVVARFKGMNSGFSDNSKVGGTPLPEKRLLEMALDKIQKKDIYGVFGVPVNPEELPDYYDVIEHPMDFGTVRKKLARNSYSSFEQFEDDVFLICSNAMQYNAPDTVYFRQASAMQDLGRKEFQKLRADRKCNGTDLRRSEFQKVRTEGKCNEADSKSDLGRTELHKRRDEGKYDATDSTLDVGRSEFKKRRGEGKCNGIDSTSDLGRTEFQKRRGEERCNGIGSTSDLGRTEYQKRRGEGNCNGTDSTSDLGRTELQKRRGEGKCNETDSATDFGRKEYHKQRGEGKCNGTNSASYLGRAEIQKRRSEGKYNADSASDLGRTEVQKRREEGKCNENGSAPDLVRTEFQKRRDDGKCNGTDSTSVLGRKEFKKQRDEGKCNQTDSASDLGRTEFQKRRSDGKCDETDSTSDLGRTEFQKRRAEGKCNGTDSTSDLGRTEFQKRRAEGKCADSSSDLGRDEFQKRRDESKCNGTDSKSDLGRTEFHKVRAEGKFSGTNSTSDFERTQFQIPRAERKLKEIEPRPDRGGKEFEELGAEEKCNVTDFISEERSRLTPIEKKSLQKSLPVNTQEPLGSDISSAATLTSPRDAYAGPKAAPTTASEPPVTVNGFTDGNSSLDESKSEKVDEPSVKDYPYKLVKKSVAVDENRRATYNMQLPMVEVDSVFVLEGEQGQLCSVGLDGEYSYARSLARFAASLGPIGWKIASQTIASALPAGVTFGPGWVGEYEPLRPSVLYLENCFQQQLDGDPAIPLDRVPNKEKGKKSEKKGREVITPSNARFDLESQSAPRMGNRDSGSVKERTSHARPIERKLQSAKISSETQPRNNPARLELQNELARKTFHMANDNTMEQARVCQQSLSNSISVNRTPHRADLGPEHATFRTPGMISFDSKFLKPEPVTQVEAQTLSREEYGRNVVKSSCSGDQNPGAYVAQHNSMGFISKEQQGVVNFSNPSASLQQGTNDPSRLMTLTRGTLHLSNTPNKVIDSMSFFPTAEQSGRESANIGASAAARAWMSVGTSSQGNLSVDVAGVCDSQARPSSIYGSWRTANSSPKTLDSPRAGVMSPAFRQTNQMGRLEPHIVRGGVNYLQSVPIDLSRYQGHAPWQGHMPQMQHRSEKSMCPPDLNVTLEFPGSPAQQHSGIVKDTQQPDLALQL